MKTETLEQCMDKVGLAIVIVVSVWVSLGLLLGITLYYNNIYLRAELSKTEAEITELKETTSVLNDLAK